MNPPKKNRPPARLYTDTCAVDPDCKVLLFDHPHPDPQGWHANRSRWEMANQIAGEDIELNLSGHQHRIAMLSHGRPSTGHQTSIRRATQTRATGPYRAMLFPRHRRRIDARRTNTLRGRTCPALRLRRIFWTCYQVTLGSHAVELPSRVAGSESRNLGAPSPYPHASNLDEGWD